MAVRTGCKNLFGRSVSVHNGQYRYSSRSRWLWDTYEWFFFLLKLRTKVSMASYGSEDCSEIHTK